jgi:predicted phage terminase large subunit-like protein
MKINKKLIHFLTSKKRFLVVYGGRGGGKSIGIADILISKSVTEKNIIILCAKQTQVSIKDSVYSLLKQRINDENLQSLFEFTDSEIRCILTKSKFIFKGLTDVENSIKSISNIKYAWVEEAQTVREDTWIVFTPSIRADNSQIFITFNPRYEDDIVYKEFILEDNPDASVVELNWFDNPLFPNVLRKQMEADKAKNYINYEYIWEGKIKKIDPHALWKPDMIVHSNKYGQLIRIVVAIDPSVTANSNSDACGIVVCGKTDDDKYVVLHDATMIASPSEWAHKAIQLYHQYKADRIVAETNQGGDLVQSVIRNIDNTVSYKGVFASKGKIIRAEPISALYEENKVIHTKVFSQLEKEMLTYTGEKNQKSPNCLDALVWGLTELSGRGVKVFRGTVKSSLTSSKTNLNNIRM